MLPVQTRYDHITLAEDNVPIITGTTMKVVELVLETTAYGWGAEELHLQHPYLSLGQIYSALAYYWDHHEEIDSDIEQRLSKVNNVQNSTQPTQLVTRLKTNGLL